MKHIRLFKIGILTAVCSMAWTGFSAQNDSPPAPPQSPQAATPVPDNPLAWDSMVKEYKALPGETIAQFTFWVTNTSSTNIVMHNVFASCGCTTPELPPMPWKMAPGVSGEIKASMDFRGKQGILAKMLTVVSSAGTQNLTVRVVIPRPMEDMAERQRNQELARADRQAVFKNDCANCHFDPTVGKKGEELYLKACAICHEPADWARASGKPGNPEDHHRAEMVPDLAALKHPLTRDMWKAIIANGKENTLMPAFAKSHGGPLTDDQIESLADFALKKFPFNPANAPKADAQQQDKPAQGTQ